MDMDGVHDNTYMNHEAHMDVIPSLPMHSDVMPSIPLPPAQFNPEHGMGGDVSHVTPYTEELAPQPQEISVQVPYFSRGYMGCYERRELPPRILSPR